MKIEIKHRYTNAVLYSTEADDLRAAVVKAVARGAYLGGANLDGAKGITPETVSRLSIVPEHGSFDGWKKLQGGLIANVLIPAAAARVGGVVGRKCRASHVVVLAIFAADGGLAEKGLGMHDGTEYVVGATVMPDKWNHDPLVECSHGIHFFLRRIEAEEYV